MGRRKGPSASEEAAEEPVPRPEVAGLEAGVCVYERVPWDSPIAMQGEGGARVRASWATWGQSIKGKGLMAGGGGKKILSSKGGLFIY